MKQAIQISSDGVNYKDLVCWEENILPVEPIIETYKYLGEHYGFLVFLSTEGDSWVFKSDSDYSYLKVGGEYELKHEPKTSHL